MNERRGGALLVAIALVALAGAILAGSSSAARQSARSSTGQHGQAIVANELRRVLHVRLTEWSTADDSLAVGAEKEEVRCAHPPCTLNARIRLRRLTLRTYVLGVSVTLGPVASPLAARSGQLILTRAQSTDPDSLAMYPKRIRQWPVSDVF